MRLFVLALVGVALISFVHARQASPVKTILWQGTISRIFVSGEGLEVISSDSPEGIFQAYMPQGQISPITSGSVQIRGILNGTTCSYGIQCVPEVDIQSITPIE